jgi:hypothetical protein
MYLILYNFQPVEMRWSLLSSRIFSFSSPKSAVKKCFEYFNSSWRYTFLSGIRNRLEKRAVNRPRFLWTFLA